MGGEAFSKARFEVVCEACDRAHRFFHGVHSVEVAVMGKNELSLATSFVPRVC